MPTAVVLGASTAGSLLSLQLARAGWEVQLVDPELDLIRRAPEGVVPRAGAPQLVQAHAYLSRNRYELTRRLPDVHEALLSAGVHELNVTDRLPDRLLDGGREGDDDLTVYQSRRLVFDRVVWQAVASQTGITRVQDEPLGLRYAGSGPAGHDSPPLVVGVTLRDGGATGADLVVDAAGRRSPVHGWLGLIGADEPEEVWECGVTYYGRHYRVGPGERPALNAGFGTVSEFPTLMMLWFIGDGDTAMLTVGAHSSDHPLKALRHEEALTVVARENPDVLPWIEMSDPTTEVFSMGPYASRMRRMVVGGTPLVLGLHHVGDALATTNPTRSRGLGMAMAAVGRLVDLVLETPADYRRVALEFDAWIRSSLTYYFREAADSDHRMGARIQVGLEGGVLPENAPAVHVPDGSPVSSVAIEHAARVDPDVVRALMRANMILDDERRIASEEMAGRVTRALSDTLPDPRPPRERPAGGLHDRSRIGDLLAPWS